MQISMIASGLLDDSMSQQCPGRRLDGSRRGGTANSVLGYEPRLSVFRAEVFNQRMTHKPLFPLNASVPKLGFSEIQSSNQNITHDVQLLILDLVVSDILAQSMPLSRRDCKTQHCKKEFGKVHRSESVYVYNDCFPILF